MKKITIILMVLLLPALLVSCQKVRKAGTSLVTITVGSGQTASLEVREADFPNKLAALFRTIQIISPAAAAVPSNVASVRVTISAADMTTITRSMNVAGLDTVTMTIEVPNGSARNFLVEGLTGGGATAYQGQASADLTGTPVDLTITLNPASVPSVSSTSPANGATDVVINTSISAVFSEPMDTTTVTTSTFTLVKTTGGTTVAGDVGLNGTTATFTPDADFATNTNYTARITTGAKSLLGFGMSQDHTWSFTTGYLPDKQAPAFSGLVSIPSTTVSLTSMQLSWNAATDAVTPSANIVYLVYRAENSGGPYTSPTYTTAPGVTTYIADGLTPGTQYYFVVRARDEAGNIDTNTVELAGVYPGVYVNAADGSDSNDGSRAAPYQTIGAGLASVATTSIEDAVFVDAGTYDDGIETFPLVLPTGTPLVCLGSNFSTMIEYLSFSAPTMVMNDQAGEGRTIIDGCKISTSSQSFPAVDDSSWPMTINRSLILGSGGAWNGVTFSAQSSITNSEITGFPGVEGGSGIDIYGNALVSRNTISGNDMGIYMPGGESIINSNIITNNNMGMYVTYATGTITISNNDISYNQQGVNIQNSYSEIRNNYIHDNTSTGIYVEETTSIVPVINSNSIYCNGSIDLSTYSANLIVIDVTNNSWEIDPLSVNQGDGCIVGDNICALWGPIPDYEPTGPLVNTPCGSLIIIPQ